MHSIKAVALLLLCAALAACEKSPAPVPPAQTPPPSAAEAVEDGAAVEAPARVTAAPPAEPPPVKQPAPAAVAKAPVAREKVAAPAPLDLGLHTHVFDPLQPLVPLSEGQAPLLPPLFVEKPAPSSPFQLHGKLITNERGDDYFESVEGAQLQFEFKQ